MLSSDLIDSGMKLAVEVGGIVLFLLKGHQSIRKRLLSLEASSTRNDAKLDAVCKHLGIKIESGPHAVLAKEA